MGKQMQVTFELTDGETRTVTNPAVADDDVLAHIEENQLEAETFAAAARGVLGMAQEERLPIKSIKIEWVDA